MGILLSHKNTFRLYQIADKTGLSKELIVNILTEAGFVIPRNNFNYILNKDQLNVLNEYFVDAIKTFYKKTQKNYKDYDNIKIKNARSFFENFVSFNHFFFYTPTNEEFFNLKLDIDKIKAYFYNLIYSFKKAGGKIYGLLEQLKYCVTSKSSKLYSDLRKKSTIFFYSGNYYSFAGEEDSLNANQLTTSFMYFKIQVEALQKSLIELKHLFWKIEKYSLEI